MFQFDPPQLSDRDVDRVLADIYGLSGTHARLRGERSHNSLVTTTTGDRYVLKVAGAGELPATIDFHAEALVHLADRAPTLPVARMQPAVDGRLVPSIRFDGQDHRMRLVTYLPGTTFPGDHVISTAGLSGIGELLGSITVALADFDHPAADEFMPWDIANGLIVDDGLWTGLGSDARSIAEPARPRLDAIVDVMRSLPRQVVHNDGHGGNLLRDERNDADVVTGLIDFGDLVRTVTVADLAVSGANLIGNQRDPTDALGSLAAGFHVHRPLSEREVSALPDLVLARMTMSALFTDYQIENSPHIAADIARERPSVLTSLQRWLDVDPAVAVRSIEDALCAPTT